MTDSHDLAAASPACQFRADPLDIPGRLEDHLGVLGVALARRELARDVSVSQQATADALEAIDAITCVLERARGQLTAGKPSDCPV